MPVTYTVVSGAESLSSVVLSLLTVSRLFTAGLGERILTGITKPRKTGEIRKHREETQPTFVNHKEGKIHEQQLQHNRQNTEKQDSQTFWSMFRSTFG